MQHRVTSGVSRETCTTKRHRRWGATWCYIGRFARDTFRQACNTSPLQRVPSTGGGLNMPNIPEFIMNMTVFLDGKAVLFNKQACNTSPPQGVQRKSPDAEVGNRHPTKEVPWHRNCPEHIGGSLVGPRRIIKRITSYRKSKAEMLKVRFSNPKVTACPDLRNAVWKFDAPEPGPFLHTEMSEMLYKESEHYL